MKRRQREASRLLIASVDDSQIALGQRPGVDPIGGDGTTRLAWSRPTSTFWSGRRRELPSTKPRLAIVYFDFTARTSNDVFPVALKPCPSTWWTTAEVLSPVAKCTKTNALKMYQGQFWENFRRGDAEKSSAPEADVRPLLAGGNFASS